MKGNGKTAAELTEGNDTYTRKGARAMVSAGRGHWKMGTPRRFGLFCLWKLGRRSVGTTPTGELYGEE